LSTSAIRTRFQPLCSRPKSTKLTAMSQDSPANCKSPGNPTLPLE
jgi:hypothetical protein